MAGYIEREAAIDIMRNAQFEYTSEEATEFISRIPAADVQPVRHGRWIDVSWCGEDYIQCSGCHYGALEHERTPYCPNCGAKMDLTIN